MEGGQGSMMGGFVGQRIGRWVGGKVNSSLLEKG